MICPKYISTFIMAACMTVIGPASSAVAGQWIVPDVQEQSNGGLARAVFMGEYVTNTPYVYRSVIEAPEQFDVAVAAIRSSQWVYVWIDGEYIGGRDAGDDEEASGNRMLHLEFADKLKPGKKHVLVVSAPEGGFALDGAFFNYNRRVGYICSDLSWTVTRYAGGTVLEDQPVMDLDYNAQVIEKVNLPACGVRVTDQWSVGDDTLMAAARRIIVKRVYDYALDIRCRLTMLVDSGDLEINGQRTRWFGKLNTASRTLRRAEYRLQKLNGIIKALKVYVAAINRTSVSLGSLNSSFLDNVGELEAMQRWLDSLAESRREREDKLVSSLAVKAYGGGAGGGGAGGGGAGVAGVAGVGELPEQIDMRPLELNRSGDLYGWLELPEMFDADTRRWGLRINPVDADKVSRSVSLSGDWSFVVDPKDAGLMAGFYGRNRPSEIAAWPKRRVPHNWARDEDAVVAAHKGPAWYSRRFMIPSEWAGLTVRLKMTVEGDERVWVNGREVTVLGLGFRKRTYELPPEILAYGSENSIFVRVVSDSAYRGLAGAVSLSCPKLVSSAGTETPPVDIASSSLSPLVVLRPQSNIIQIRHTGTAALAIPQGGTIATPTRNYKRVEHRKLGENWVVLWLHPRNPWDVVRPVQLIFQHNPRSIRCLKGVTEIELDGPGETVMAVRPWSRTGQHLGDSEINLLTDARLWSRLARAVPVNYVSVPRVRSGGVISHTIAYDYLVTEDDWGVEPLFVAPLPGGVGLAMDSSNDVVSVADTDKLVKIHDGRDFGAYRAVMDAQSISYTAKAQSMKPSLNALTCDFGMVDVSDRSCELAAEMGLNAIRWVHRWNSDKAIVNDVATTSGTSNIHADRKMRPIDMASALSMQYIHACEGMESKPDQAVTQAQAEGYLTAISQDILKRLEGFEAVNTPVALEVCTPPSESGAFERLHAVLASLGELKIAAPVLLSPHPMETVAIAGKLPVTSRAVAVANGVRLDLSTASYYALESPRPPEDVDNQILARGLKPLLLEAIINGKYIYCSYLGFGLAKDLPVLPQVTRQLMDLMDQFGASWSFLRADGLFRLREDGSIYYTPQGRAVLKTMQQRSGFLR